LLKTVCSSGAKLNAEGCSKRKPFLKRNLKDKKPNKETSIHY
jgi:hypothetical protein